MPEVCHLLITASCTPGDVLIKRNPRKMFNMMEKNRRVLPERVGDNPRNETADPSVTRGLRAFSGPYVPIHQRATVRKQPHSKISFTGFHCKRISIYEIATNRLQPQLVRGNSTPVPRPRPQTPYLPLGLGHADVPSSLRNAFESSLATLMLNALFWLYSVAS